MCAGRLSAWRTWAVAATNALDHESDIAKVQEWLGYANIATTRIYKIETRRLPTYKLAVILVCQSEHLPDRHPPL